MPRIIFHIDVNSAFLSWTAVKMVREGKPDILAPTGTPVPPPTAADEPPKHYRCQNSGANSVTRSASKDDALVFTYDNGEKALSAAKKAIKDHPDYRFHLSQLSDGTDCFEVVSGTKVLERHCVTNKNR